MALIEPKNKFNLKTPFTEDQKLWLEDEITAFMAWFAYESAAIDKMKKRVELLLEKIRTNRI